MLYIQEIKLIDIVSVFFDLKSGHMVKSFSDIPSPKEHWLKGSIGKFETHLFHRFLYQCTEELGSICKIHLWRRPIVLISDSEVRNHIMVNRPDLYKRSSQLESVFKSIGIHGVFTSEGDDWRLHRKMINPAFKPSSIQKFYDSINEICDRLCQTIESQDNAFDFQNIIQRFTVDVTTTLSFGKNLNTLENPNNDIQKDLEHIVPAIGRRMKSGFPYWSYVTIGKDKILNKSIERMRSNVELFIENAREQINENGKATNILQEMLLNPDVDEEEIFGNVITLLIAGEDTTANTIAWTLDLLVDRPDILEEVQEEITQNYPRKRELRWDDLQNFPLVFALAQEALRLKPVTPFVHAEGKEDLELLGYKIPKGTMLMLNNVQDGITSTYFDDYNEFVPQRWLQMDKKTLRDYNRSVAPFGSGSRMCPGRQLAYVEIRLVLIKLLAQFAFERPEGRAPAQECLSMTMSPAGLMLKAIPRSGAEYNVTA